MDAISFANIKNAKQIYIHLVVLNSKTAFTITLCCMWTEMNLLCRLRENRFLEWKHQIRQILLLSQFNNQL